MKVYRRIARLVQILSQSTPLKPPYYSRRRLELAQIMRGAPSGSGFDAGTELADPPTRSDNGAIRFESAYHHLSPHGYDDGWNHFVIEVHPDLVNGFNLKLKSIGPWNPKYADTKEYIIEMFEEFLQGYTPRTPLPSGHTSGSRSSSEINPETRQRIKRNTYYRGDL